MIDLMLNDFRFAFRVLLKNPAFTLVAIATIALAIGANTAVFSLVNALLIRPLPYRAPSGLVLLWEKFSGQGLDVIPVSAPEYLDYEKQTRSFAGIAACDYVDLNLTGGEMLERIQGAVVSPSLFPLLGVEPVRGRVFTPSEYGEGNDGVVVISERLWQRRFNSDGSLVGKQISLNGRLFTVIGIMPSKFEFPIPLFNIQGGTFSGRVDIWKPIAFTKNELESRGSRSYGVIARLKSGVTTSQAQAELNTIVANWIPRFPGNYSPQTRFGATLYPLHEQVIGGMRTALWILSGAVGLVLLIACANLTTMLLARAGGREREFAIRVALGAGRMQLLRQILSESVLLAIVGGAAGSLLAVWGLELLRTIGAKTVPRIAEANLDTRVLLVTLIVTVSTGILFGLIPALASSNPELTEALKEGGRGSTTGLRRNRIRNSLVVAEVALALVLLISAGLLIKSFVQLQKVDPGFNPKHVLTMELSLPLIKYPRGKPVSDFYAEVERRVARIPGVEHVALTTILPLSGSNSDSSFHIEGRDEKQTNVFPDEELRVITPDYFRVLETPLLKGRFFNGADNADAPKVVIINQAMANKYWPGEDSLGKRINFNDEDPAKIDWFTVVGVVGDIRHRGLDAEAKPEYYLVHQQRPYRGMILAARSRKDPRALVSSIRRELQSFDPEQPLANIKTLEQIAGDSVAPRRLSVVLLGVFAAVALILASVGIYGVMSFLVVQRTHELGVRMALGAQRRDVLRLIVGHGMKLIAIGTAIGLILAISSVRALGAMLYNVGAFDLSTFIGVTFALGPVALLASYIPAARVVRADPMSALAHNG
ncbi:MAG: ABC transporter permease [Chthoniobacterales bacterium]|nr:MAG: ABC transporter permease [Chthoniobacterales bacterium]